MRSLLFLSLLLLLQGCHSGPHSYTTGKTQNPPAETKQKSSEREPVNVKLGVEFKIKNISGTEVTVSIVEKAGKHYIRSTYHHAGMSEPRDYVITNAVDFVSTSGRGIQIWFPHAAEAKIAGTVYVINNHGEAVKVDDITTTDLTW